MPPTTAASGNHAALMLLAAARDEPFLEDGTPKDTEKAQYFVICFGTLFAAGFESELSCIGINESYKRPSSFQSGNGAVRQIHAADSAAFYRRCPEQTRSLVAVGMGAPD